MSDNWRHALRFFFGTWQRALLTSVILLVVIFTGLLAKLVSILIVSVFYPLLIIGLLLLVLRWVFHGGRRT